MKYFIQINKLSKRVMGYGSTKSESDECIQIPIDSDNLNFEELFKNPFIFIYDEINNTFAKDIKYQDELIKKHENNIPDSQKIINLTKELAANKLESMKKDQTIKMLTSQQAAIMLDIMKLKGSN